MSDSQPGTSSSRFSRIGGRRCFDFTNTIAWSEPPHGEELHSYDDLVDWALAADVLTADEAAQLRAEAARRPADAAAALDRARDARAAMHAVFHRLAHREEPRPEDVARFNAYLTEAMTRVRVAPAGCECSWSWREDPRDLARMLWPVIWSAASVLTSPDVRWVRHCASETCGWLFLDESRNHNRRWCDMRECGSREKARRHYRRKTSARRSD
jgi:predicted RNA-binding Zn ribbon-like protein